MTKTDRQLYDVIEVEIRNPKNRRVMETNLSEKNSDAFIYMAVVRRGCETHFYIKEPVPTAQGL